MGKGIHRLYARLVSFVSNKRVVVGTSFTTDDSEGSFSNLVSPDSMPVTLKRGAKLFPLGNSEKPERYLVLIESTGEHVILETHIVNTLFKKGTPGGPTIKQSLSLG